MSVPTLNPGSRITGDDRIAVATQLAEAYAKGASIRTLAAQTGRSFGFVHRLLVESKTQLRSRGGANRRRQAAIR